MLTLTKLCYIYNTYVNITYYVILTYLFYCVVTTLTLFVCFLGHTTPNILPSVLIQAAHLLLAILWSVGGK